MDTMVRASAISRRADEVGLMISFGIDRADLASEEGLPPRDPHPHLGPLPHSGRELPGLVGADDRFVHVASRGLDYLHVAHLAAAEDQEGDGHGGALPALQAGR